MGMQIKILHTEAKRGTKCWRGLFLIKRARTKQLGRVTSFS